MTYKDIKGIINTSGIPFKGVLNKVTDWVASTLGQNEPEEYTYLELYDLVKHNRIQPGKKYILKEYTTYFYDTDLYGTRKDFNPNYNPIYYDILLTGKSSNEFENDVDLKISDRKDNGYVNAIVPSTEHFMYFEVLDGLGKHSYKVRAYYYYTIYIDRILIDGEWVSCSSGGPTINYHFLNNNYIEVSIRGGYSISIENQPPLYLQPQTIIVNTETLLKENPISIKGKYSFIHYRNKYYNELYNIDPNIIIFKKAISNGMHLYAVTACRFLNDTFTEQPSNVTYQKIELYNNGFWHTCWTPIDEKNKFLFSDSGTALINPGDEPPLFVSQDNIIINIRFDLLTNITIPEQNIDIDYDFLNISLNVTNALLGGGGSGSGASGSGEDDSDIEYLMTFDDLTNISNLSNITIKWNKEADIIPFNYCNVKDNKLFILEDSCYNIIYRAASVNILNSRYNQIGYSLAEYFANIDLNIENSNYCQLHANGGNCINSVNLDVIHANDPSLDEYSHYNLDTKHNFKNASGFFRGCLGDCNLEGSFYIKVIVQGSIGTNTTPIYLNNFIGNNSSINIINNEDGFIMFESIHDSYNGATKDLYVHQTYIYPIDLTHISVSSISFTDGNYLLSSGDVVDKSEYEKFLYNLYNQQKS